MYILGQICTKPPWRFTGVEHTSLFSVANRCFTSDSSNNAQGSEAETRKSTGLSELLGGCGADQSQERF